MLTRLILQGHPIHGQKALKRLLEFDANKRVRSSVGTPLHQSILQVSGHGVCGIPKMPNLRQLFLKSGGLICIALDSELSTMFFKKACIEFICGLTIPEWRQRPLDQLEAVIEHFVIPSLENSDEEIRAQAEMIFGRIYSLQLARDNLGHWCQKLEGNGFVNYVLKETLANKKAVPNNPLESTFLVGETLAKKWNALSKELKAE